MRWLKTTALIGGPVLLLAAAASLLLTGAARNAPAPSEPPATATLPSKPMSILGVYEPGTPRTYAPVIRFGYAAGRQPDVVLCYSGWMADFNTPFADAAWKYGATTFDQIDAPGKDLTAIAAGKYDTQLGRFADQVRNFRHPVLLSYEPEANGPWYSWGYRHEPAADFIAAWRHIVTLFRAHGARNVMWVWTVNRMSPGVTGPPSAWWPGAAYVSWVGIDGYIETPAQTFANTIQPTITAIRSFTSKPVLLSETAIGPDADQAMKLPGLFTGIKADNLIGMVWFDRTQNGSVHHQDWRLEDTPGSVQNLFRQLVNYAYAGG